MPARLFLSSGDLIADRRFDYARDLQLKGDLAAAADLLPQALELAPAWAPGLVHVSANPREGSASARRRDRGLPRRARSPPDDRHGAGLRLMRARRGRAVRACRRLCARRCSINMRRGSTPSLVDDLGYRGPALLFTAVLAVARRAQTGALFRRAIDLGCGTGLMPRAAFAAGAIASTASTCRRA